jgi:6-phosphogluconolactonase (cycloisomerase 2 family)
MDVLRRRDAAQIIGTWVAVLCFLFPVLLTAATPPTAYLYTSSGSITGPIFGFRLNDLTGVPTEMTPIPIPGGLPIADPSGRFLYTYISNITVQTTLSEYLIDPTSGALKQAPGSPYEIGQVSAVAITPNDRFLYAVIAVGENLEDYEIVGFSMDAISGELTSTGAAIPLSSYANVLAMDPSGLFLYSGSGQIFSVNQANGALTQVGIFDAGSSQLLFSPSGSRLYEAIYAEPDFDIVVYSVNASTGLLTLVQTFVYSQEQVVSFAPFFAVDPEDRFFYIITGANSQTAISGYYINPKNGAIESEIAGSPFAGSTDPLSIALDSSGAFLYVPDNGGGLGAYSRNAATGSLTPIAGSPFIGSYGGWPTFASKVTRITATLTGLSVSPATDSIVSAQPGITAQFLAVGQYSDGVSRFLTSSSEWSSSDTGVATISNTPGSDGLTKTVGPGQTTLTASYGGLTANATLSVSAAPLTSITVTPANLVVKTGVSPQMTATGIYSDGSQQNLTDLVTWSSSSSAVATVSSDGLATAVANGNTVISASQGSVTGATNLYVR